MKARPASQLAVPMAPMIDVVFQLLIYFILTFHADVPEAHLVVNLPSDRVGPPMSGAVELRIEPGQVWLQGRPRSLASVRENLVHLGGLDPELPVIVKVSPLARAQELVGVLDVCKDADLKNLNVVRLQ